jgi:hypothetical protein
LIELPEKQRLLDGLLVHRGGPHEFVNAFTC